MSGTPAPASAVEDRARVRQRELAVVARLSAPAHESKICIAWAPASICARM